MNNKYFKDRIFGVILLISVIIPAAAHSQVIGLLTLERLSLLDTYRTGARPMALGTAYTAVSDDAFALLYNPAGLTQIEKNEIIFGVQHFNLDIDNEYETWNTATSNSYTSFGHIAMATPVGSYGNNIVLGFGIFRVGNSDAEYIRKGLRPDLDGMLENVFLQSGSIFQYRFGIGIELMENISAGATLVLWDESVTYTETIRFNQSGSDSSYNYINDSGSELDGISVDFGLMMWLNQYMRAGVTFSSPVALSYVGNGTDYYDGTNPDGSTWETDSESLYSEDDLTLPMRFAGGVSFLSGPLLLAADLSYCDYSQTKYNGLRLTGDEGPGRQLLGEALDFSIGGEFVFPSMPLTVRAGYSYMPLKLKAMDELTYVTDTVDEWGLVTEYDFIDVNVQRRFFTFGIGGIIEDMLAIDFALAIGSFERETRYLKENRDILELVVTAGYSF
ncbi:MAG: hypothetical protein JW814_07935 [Candidatus Krumholzibacteriota bacterium]|nr:hypothetical protein [Candidatus Krumholzibacteriota bacterium]